MEARLPSLLTLDLLQPSVNWLNRLKNLEVKPHSLYNRDLTLLTRSSLSLLDGSILAVKLITKMVTVLLFALLIQSKCIGTYIQLVQTCTFSVMAFTVHAHLAME